jgi:hypothetical protein
MTYSHTIVITVALLACAPADDEPEAMTTPDGSTGASPTTDAVTSSTEGDDSSSSGESSGSGGSSGDTTGSGPASSCSEAVLFAGDYEWDGNGTPDPAGVPLLGSPPVGWQQLALAGSLLYTNTLKEVWVTDLAAASPVTRRIAGALPDETDGGVEWFRDGTCADARFLELDSLAVAPDGALFVADKRANAILRVDAPTEAACSVSYFAGTNVDLEDPGNASPSGDEDGPLDTALFTQPKYLTAAADGSFVFVDSFNRKVKRIEAGSLSTVLQSPQGEAHGPFDVLGETLYASHKGAPERIVAISFATGEESVVASADDFPGLGVGSNPVIEGLDDDGEGLLAFGRGYIWYVALDGEVTLVAGSGEFDFPPGFDATVPQPALEFPLLFSGRSGFAYDLGRAFVRGNRSNFANPALVFEVTCP